MSWTKSFCKEMLFSKTVAECKPITFFQFKTSAFHTLFKAFMSLMVLLISVNGNWSQWSSWQPCSVTCGAGHRIRARTCSNPAPKWNGKDCPGTNIYIESCNIFKCKGSFMAVFSWKWRNYTTFLMLWYTPYFSLRCWVTFWLLGCFVIEAMQLPWRPLASRPMAKSNTVGKKYTNLMPQD